MLFLLTPLAFQGDMDVYPSWQIKDLFYRGLFTKAIGLIQNEPSPSQQFNFYGQLSHAAILIEQGKYHQARLGLQKIQSTIATSTAASLEFVCKTINLNLVAIEIQYLEATIHSREGRFHEAMDLYAEISQSLQEEDVIPGVLGQRLTTLAEIGSMLSAICLNFEEVATHWFQILSSKISQTSPDTRIQLYLALSQHALVIIKDPKLSSDLAKRAFSESTVQSWAYFSAPALIMIARGLRFQKNDRELQWTLDLLHLMLEGSELQQPLHQINLEFKDEHNQDIAIEFDDENKRVFMGGEWLRLHERPILFDFLMLLRQRVDFLDKKSIAEALWPMEAYKSRIHDPRIFDIAKRARNLIQNNQSQQVALLSGRMGYKLANC